ncbi:MAG: cytochrome c biogenesis protein CcsA [Chlamydiales bacterium]|nr:cytochrome c biogenesis protein CcsA [Chlamydiales bacterium]
MYQKVVLFFIGLSLIFCSAFSSEFSVVPTLYKGRIRPFSTYAHAWLNDIAGNSVDINAEEFLWNLYLFGYTPYEKMPLFLIASKPIKELLSLNLEENHFSYKEIKHAKTIDDKNLNHLKEKIYLFTAFGNGVLNQNKQMNQASFSLTEELLDSDTFLLLPLKVRKEEWISLSSLAKTVGKKNLISNFTPYTDAAFKNLQEAYLSLEKMQRPTPEMASSLLNAYQEIAGSVYTRAEGKALYYPTLFQLQIEHFTYLLPFTETALFFYILAIIALLFFLEKKIGLGLFLAAFSINTCYLVLRCIVLERPPVTNMFESVIYVPFIASFVALILYRIFKNRMILLAASTTSCILLLIVYFTHIDKGLENVQAVLDSGYWLVIHVLMVVGSYALFILAGVLAHFYLGIFFLKNKESKILSTLILQCMYVGIALLISGTILGGIWAAESWGRFWDWDPKESWAFISSCIYLLWIHAYRFKIIKSFGLAMGAILGLLAISFTWYGVNYVLGTGLHSYGFGSGGEVYYYLFLGIEALFLSTILISYKFNPFLIRK